LPDGWSVSVPLSNFIDVPKECARLNEEFSRIQQQLSVVTKRLRDKAFCTRAPANVVKKEREREKTWRDQRDVLAGKLKALGCS
jgi:valyl-tRNA synthetase